MSVLPPDLHPSQVLIPILSQEAIAWLPEIFTALAGETLSVILYIPRDLELLLERIEPLTEQVALDLVLLETYLDRQKLAEVFSQVHTLLCLHHVSSDLIREAQKWQRRILYYGPENAKPEGFSLVRFGPEKPLKTWLSEPLPPACLDLTPEEVQTYLSAAEDVRVAGLFYWGRSGTFFVHSLLDSHPDVMTFPVLTLGHFYRVWEILTDEMGAGSLFTLGHTEELVDYFVAQVAPAAFDSDQVELDYTLKKLGPYQQEPLWVDAALFKNYFLTLARAHFEHHPTLKRKHFFVFVHQAYTLAVEGKSSPKPLIFFHGHNPHDALTYTLLLQDFPGFQAIGMLRDPMAGFYSMLQHMWKSHQKSDSKPMEKHAFPGAEWSDLFESPNYLHWYNHMLIGWRLLEKQFGFPIHAIELEMLHKDPLRTLQDIAKKLNIRWHVSLLESSFGGLSYAFYNPYSQDLIQGFSYERVSQPKWKARFSSRDAEILRFLSPQNPRIRLFDEHGLGAEAVNQLIDICLPFTLELHVAKEAFYQGQELLFKKAVMNYVERVLFSLRVALDTLVPHQDVYPALTWLVDESVYSSGIETQDTLSLTPGDYSQAVLEALCTVDSGEHPWLFSGDSPVSKGVYLNADEQARLTLLGHEPLFLFRQGKPSLEDGLKLWLGVQPLTLERALFEHALTHRDQRFISKLCLSYIARIRYCLRYAFGLQVQEDQSLPSDYPWLAKDTFSKRT